MFLQIKDLKNIEWDFCSDAKVMPQGWDLGDTLVPKGSKFYFFEHGHVAYQINGDNE